MDYILIKNLMKIGIEYRIDKIKKATNSRFSQLRVLWEVHFCVPQNFLSLTENNQFRTSQLREAAERCASVSRDEMKRT